MAYAGDIHYNRKTELKAFDDTKPGEKGLLDAGITKVPRIFIHRPPKNYPTTHDPKRSVPVIDLDGIEEDKTRRLRVVEEVKRASESGGFFQIVNHGVPGSVMEEMIEGVRRFHEMDTEVKMGYYTRDETRRFKFNSNFDLYRSPVADWRDSFNCVMAPRLPELGDSPEVCRDIMTEYSKQVAKVGNTLCELLSEALGLNRNHLKEKGCADGVQLVGHYYPACPEPEIAIGTSSHVDSDFFTVLLQDQIGGLQVLFDDQWVDVPPVAGARVINMGDLMQIISSDKFKSVNHRVLAMEVGPRISVACFFRSHVQQEDTERVYGPIEELLSEENPPIYRETTMTEYLKCYYSMGEDTKPPSFMLKISSSPELES